MSAKTGIVAAAVVMPKGPKDGPSLLSRCSTWATHQGNQGIAGLALLLESIDQLLQHRNSDPLGTLLGKKTAGTQDNARMRKIVALCIGGIKVVKDTKHFTGIKWTLGDNMAETENLAVLRDLVKNKADLRRKDVADFIKGEGKKETTVDEYTVRTGKSIAKFCTEHNISLADFVKTALLKAVNQAAKEIAAKG